jgi:hypothetical protein
MALKVVFSLAFVVDSHGWSRPDGSIILTNNSVFDPAVELQQNWVRMEKVRP